MLQLLNVIITAVHSSETAWPDAKRGFLHSGHHPCRL